MSARDHLAVCLFAALCACAFSADDALVRVSERDIKKASPDALAYNEKFRAEATSEEERALADRVALQLYGEALIDFANDHWQDTPITKERSWPELWTVRATAAVDTAGQMALEADALRIALEHARDFDGEIALVLERAVRANFGSEKVWVLILHWEIADVVEKKLSSEAECKLGHIRMMAFRISDGKLVAWTTCG